MNVCFSNRPVWVKRFQTFHRWGVDVAHGLALLFGIGAKALLFASAIAVIMMLVSSISYFLLPVSQFPPSRRPSRRQRRLSWREHAGRRRAPAEGPRIWAWRVGHTTISGIIPNVD
jgi:hypothetical protein